MKKDGKQSGSIWIASMLCGLAYLVTPISATSGMVATPEVVENKMRLVKLLLAESPVVKRIPQSNNVAAQKNLADAQALLAKADAEKNAGRIEPAIKLLDQALLGITAASRLVPDTAYLTEQERLHYSGLRESVLTFIRLQQDLAVRFFDGKPTENVLPRLQSSLDTAEKFAGLNNYKQANATLNEAYKTLVSSINKMLMAKTIVYGLKFDTPKDEYRHELARNLSYEELIPLALKQFNPPQETVLLSERYVQRSKELRESAQKQADKGDYSSAVKTIQDATSQLQRSLQIAGVVVPQSQEGSNP